MDDLRITLNLDDALHASLKMEAARQGQTMSSLVDAALRLLLTPAQEPAVLPPLPVYEGGGSYVDVANRARSTRRWMIAEGH